MQIAHWYIDKETKEKREQSIIEHLNGTAAFAECFGTSFGEPVCAKLIAQAHDIGKYSIDFQERIRGLNVKVDHSTAGAREISKQRTPLGLLAAYCIMGHHGGMPDGGRLSQSQSEPGTLFYRLENSTVPDYSAYSREVEINFPKVPQTWSADRENMGFSLAFLTRMLFSCLVDADWLDTERFMKQKMVERDNFKSIEVLFDSLSQYLKELDTTKKDDSKIDINKKRKQLRNDCYNVATKGCGLFSLTAPTGSGKTISSLTFALKHAVENNMDRVIYVVPYNTIIEQNAKVFEDIFGESNVVQHHSNIEYEDDDSRRFAIENWDAPIIVTSNVQFFESLYSNKPGKCRKLHNIANSVIIFDEAQMIPLPHLFPCVYAIAELMKNCRCSTVLVTATQSSLNEYFFPLKITEINSQPKQMYEDFIRVKYVVEDKPFSDEFLVSELIKNNKVLCIVNTRKKAQQIASQIKDCYHLSTTMYPAHRTKIINEIRDKLAHAKQCRVVSTSLMEAGVDLDFPQLYREKAGLDSVIQAGGRCNREGKNDFQNSIVHVFGFDKNSPPGDIQQNISAFEHVRQNHSDISSPEAIKSYFEWLRYIIGKEKLDKNNAIREFNAGITNGFSFPFKTVAEQFHVIENEQKTIVIDTKDSKALCNLLRQVKATRKELHQIQQFSVNVYPNDFKYLQNTKQIEILDNGIAIMNECFYDKKYGILLRTNK